MSFSQFKCYFPPFLKFLTVGVHTQRENGNLKIIKILYLLSLLAFQKFTDICFSFLQEYMDSNKYIDYLLTELEEQRWNLWKQVDLEYKSVTWSYSYLISSKNNPDLTLSTSIQDWPLSFLLMSNLVSSQQMKSFLYMFIILNILS